MKTWISLWFADCPDCSGMLESEHYTQDGDDWRDGAAVRCTECKISGWLTADEDGVTVNFEAGRD